MHTIISITMNEEHNKTQGAASEAHTAEGAAEGNQEFVEMKESLSDDVERHKTLAIIGYILPILFFLPFLSDEGKKSEFARFHANQHLILLIALVGLYFVHSFLFAMFFVGGYFIMNLINLAFLVLMIIGVINAAKGEMKELPLIGGFKLLNR